MAADNPIPDDKKVDHLILLVGGNPLPNAVAGRLLVNPGGRITLVHSKTNLDQNIQGTGDIANRLGQWLKGAVETREVEESNPQNIRDEVTAELNNKYHPVPESVGLNYTGGTKAMAVHAYLAVQSWAAQKGVKTVFSYLDPRTLQMRFDNGMPEPVGLAVDISLKDMLNLHGGRQVNRYHRAKEEVLLPETAQRVLETYLNPNESKDWFKWREDYLKPHRLPKSKWNTDRKDYQNWIDNNVLRELVIPWPPHVHSTLEDELRALGYAATGELNIREAVQTLNHRIGYVEELMEWLWAQWLEHYALHCLQQNAIRRRIQTTVTSVVTYPRRFEVDVVGIRGYQLFAISCATNGLPEKVKPKLFEAAVRAQQLGGDEARIALVCFSDNPTELVKEMKSTIDPRVMVFGKKDLRNLAEKLSEWIATQVGKE